MVATDDLLAQAAMLQLLHDEAAGWQARLRRIRSLEFEPAPTWTPSGRAADLYAAVQAVDTVEAHSAELANALAAAAEGYGRAERLAELLTRYSGAGTAYLLGRLAPLLAALAVPILTGGAAAWLLGSVLSGTKPADAPGRLAGVVRRNPRLLTNPVLVQAVRVMVSSVDDAAAGAFGVPWPVTFPLGDEGIGMLGVGTSAAGVLGLARPFGLLRETAVSTAPVQGRPVPAALSSPTRASPTRASPTPVPALGSPGRALPPAGLADLVARIPPASRDGPQVRIERYGPSTKPAWVVYVGGTVEWDPRAGGEPWDLTSNVAAIADGDNRAGSYRAVVQAMQEAGVQPADPVVQVGHSQGGLIAAQVAASARFNTVAVASFGAPNGQVPVPDSVPMIRVEHSDDLVPALGGTARDTTAAGSAHLVVRREVYAMAEVPADQPVPAHSLRNYRDTAQLIDGSAEPRLVTFRSHLGGLFGRDAGDVTMWRATRTGAPG
jgi:hypothetical protein